MGFALQASPSALPHLEFQRKMPVGGWYHGQGEQNLPGLLEFIQQGLDAAPTEVDNKTPIDVFHLLMDFYGLLITTVAVPGVCKCAGGAQCCTAEDSAVSCFCKGLFLLVVVVKTNMWENNGILFFCFPLHFKIQ